MNTTQYNRILLEINAEALMGKHTNGVDAEAIARVCEQIKNAYTKHIQMAVTISGSNVFRGFEQAKTVVSNTTLDYIEMLATVMNGLAVQDALESIGIPTRLQSALQMPAIAENFIRRKAIRHMEKGRVVILCAGAGVPFVTTDTSACLYALELNCDVVLKAISDNKHSSIADYQTLHYADALQIPTTEFDHTALAMAKENGLPIVIFELFKQEGLLSAIHRLQTGTTISNQETKKA